MVRLSRREAERGNKELARLIDELVVFPAERSIREAFRLGVRIGAGTDTLGDLVDELLLLRSCGIPAEECLAACTRTAAEILGLEQVIGTVEPGKVADLVVVDGNPLRDLGALRRVRTVIKGGELVDLRWLMGEAREGARGTHD
jgi:imidazolonepropionase-like amidohydrolase